MDFSQKQRQGLLWVLALQFGTLLILYLVYLNLQDGLILTKDFSVFYSTAKYVAAPFAGVEALYDQRFFFDYMAQQAPGADSLPLRYPPTLLFTIIPLSLFDDPILAYCFLCGATMLLCGIAAYGLCRHRVALAFLVFPLISATVWHGQVTALLLLPLAAGLMLLGRYPIAAGLCFALVTVKPQLALLIPFALLGGGQIRAFAAMVGGVIALFLATALLFGPAVWVAFIQTMLYLPQDLESGQNDNWKHMITLYAFAKLFDLPQIIALSAQVAASTISALVVFLVWRLEAPAPAAKAAVLVVGGFLATPYAYGYDLLLLLVPTAVIAREIIEGPHRPADRILVALIWFAPPLLLLLSSGLAIPYWPILLTGLLFWIVRETYVDQGSCFYHGTAELQKQGAVVNARLR